MFRIFLRKKLKNCDSFGYFRWNFLVFCYSSSNKIDIVQFFKIIFLFIQMKIRYYFEKFWVFTIFLWNIVESIQFFDKSNAILMRAASFSITFDHVSTIWYSHLHAFFSTSELFKSKSTRNQCCSVLKTQCFRVRKVSAEQRWFRADSLRNSAEFFSSEQRSFTENQSWSALK